MIDHESLGYKVWKSFINALCIITSFIYAYFASFIIPLAYKGRRRMQYVEFIFLIDLIIQFFRSYDPKTATKDKKVKDMSKICLNYLRNDFIWHAIPLIPLHHLALCRRRNDMLYVLKVIRMKRGLENYNQFNEMLKDIYNKLTLKRTIDQYTYDKAQLNIKKQKQHMNIDQTRDADREIE